jgi:osmoprotectant transport system substrate-binding protein
MRLALLAVLAALAPALAGCGADAPQRTLTVTTMVATIPPPPPPLPGTGKPAVTIGDKNFTEQFLLGQLYYQALKAQGYTVSLDRNIGPTEVTLQGLANGTISMYPEYLSTWDSDVAGYHRHFSGEIAALRAGRSYALDHGYQLLNPTPFSDTQALAVSFNYAVANNLTSIGDLIAVAGTLTIGGPPQFATDPTGLPALERTYGIVPAAFKPLEIGGQYQALDQGMVQAADVNTTDGQLITGNYTLLADPKKVFGWGNVVPVVPLKVIAAEGPQFAATINRVTALLTLTAMRQLNTAVDIENQDPATVATQFLEQHGLIAPAQGTS